MKNLHDVIRATQEHGAEAVIEMARGSPKLKDCFVVTAIPFGNVSGSMTTILVDPDHNVDDASFDHFLADLDDPKTWASVGATPPRARTP